MLDTVRAASKPALLVCLAAVGTGAYAVFGGFSSGSAQAGGNDPDSPALQAFRIFRDPGQANQTEVRKIMAALPPNALDASTARRAIATSDYQVHVIGGPKELCLAVREANGGGSLGCTDPAVGADGHRPLVSLDFLGQGRWRVTGVVPDGTADIALSTAGAESRQLTIINNVFSTTVSTTPLALSFTAPDGSVDQTSFPHLTD